MSAGSELYADYAPGERNCDNIRVPPRQAVAARRMTGHQEESQMARYRIRYWKEFPSVVRAEDEHGQAKAILPPRFQDAIDRAAMVSGETSEEAYLEGWTWGPVKELPGTADRVVNLIVAKLDMEYPDERLEEMVRAHRRVSD